MWFNSYQDPCYATMSIDVTDDAEVMVCGPWSTEHHMTGTVGFFPHTKGQLYVKTQPPTLQVCPCLLKTHVLSTNIPRIIIVVNFLINMGGGRWRVKPGRAVSRQTPPFITIKCSLEKKVTSWHCVICRLKEEGPCVIITARLSAIMAPHTTIYITDQTLQLSHFIVVLNSLFLFESLGVVFQSHPFVTVCRLCIYTSNYCRKFSLS